MEGRLTLVERKILQHLQYASASCGERHTGRPLLGHSKFEYNQGSSAQVRCHKRSQDIVRRRQNPFRSISTGD